MKFLLAPLAILAGLTAVLGQLTINTPTNVVVCQPILLNWSGGTGPFIVSVLPGSQPGAQALVTFPQTDSNSLTWNVNVAAGTSVGLTIRDSTGATASSAPFSINSGSDTSCVGQSSSTSSGTGTSTGTTPTTAGATTPTTGTTTRTSTSTPATTSPSGTTTRPSTTTGTTSSGTSSTRPATTSNAAPTQGAHLGAAGLIGAAVIALMA